MIKKPELLAPAGNMESLIAAVNSGCDAVYLGGKQFSARQAAGNFSNEELEEAAQYCHLRGVKLFVTINTLYKERELPDFLKFASFLKNIGIDGVIIQDVGAAKLLREKLPELRLHASTQMTAHSLKDVQYLEEQGFKRVVLSRELSLEEIKNIKENTHIEIECFIHGALCVCYSGQCLFSSLLGGRSGNRGRCAQPCRLKYSVMKKTQENEESKTASGYLLSPKDVSTVKILPQLIEAGINSFKIEGRMKKPEYVAGVTEIYRKYIDMFFNNSEAYKVEVRDIRILEQLFNRGGFTKGYFEEYAGKDMMSIEKPKNWGVYLGKVDSVSQTGKCNIKTVEDLVPGDGIEVWTSVEPHCGSNISKASQRGEVISVFIKDEEIKKGDLVYKTNDKALMDKLAKAYEKPTRQMPIYGEFSAKVGEPVYMKVWNDSGVAVEACGAIAEKSQNQPADEEKIMKQINKTGNTPFRFADMKLNLAENVYISVSALNEIRREVLDKLQDRIIANYKDINSKEAVFDRKLYPKSRGDKSLSVLVQSYEQLMAAFESDSIVRIYFELKKDILDKLDAIIQECKGEGIELFAALPRIQRDNEKEVLSKIASTDIDGYLVRTWGQLYSLKQAQDNKNIAIDYTFNIFNSESIASWKEAGCDTVALSPELNYNEINGIGCDFCESIGYGYLPLMVTHQCPIGNYDGNRESGRYCAKRYSKDSYFIKDRLGMEFPILTDCDECVSYIYNSQPIFIAESMDEILKLPTGMLRLQFTNETAQQVKDIAYIYGEKIKNYKNTDDDIERIIAEFKEKGYTKGHYFRGVE